MEKSIIGMAQYGINPILTQPGGNHAARSSYIVISNSLAKGFWGIGIHKGRTNKPPRGSLS